MRLYYKEVIYLHKNAMFNVFITIYFNYNHYLKQVNLISLQFITASACQGPHKILDIH